jgi:hypothetical protein
MHERSLLTDIGRRGRTGDDGSLKARQKLGGGPDKNRVVFRESIAKALMLFVFWTDSRQAKPLAASMSFANYNKVFSDSALCA